MTGGSAPTAGRRARDGLFVVDVLTVFAGVAALGVLLLVGLGRWFVGGFDVLAGGLGALGFACGALLVLAAGLVLERMRWDRRAGHGATFDERFRWIDTPETEEAHEAAAISSAPGWVRALRPAAYGMSAVALLTLSLASGNVAYTLYLVGAAWPAWTSLLRRAWGRKALPPPADAVRPRDAGGVR